MLGKCQFTIKIKYYKFIYMVQEISRSLQRYYDKKEEINERNKKYIGRPKYSFSK
jgi:hypothetical protein